MPDGEYQRYATQREFDDFRDETRKRFEGVDEELQWIRRGLIYGFLAVLVAQVAASVLSFFLRPPVPAL